MTQMATVDLRKGELIVCSLSQTVPGFWITSGPFFRIPEDSDDNELAGALDQALSSSRRNASAPPVKGRGPFAPVLEALGLRSYAEYMRGSLSVGITRDDSEVVVTPKLNGGARAGFTELLDQVETLHDSSALAIAQAVRRALGRAA